MKTVRFLRPAELEMLDAATSVSLGALDSRASPNDSLIG